MKRIILIFIITLEISKSLLLASLPGISPVSNSPWLKSGSVSSVHKKLINSVKSYPSMGTFLNEDGVTYTAHQYPNDRSLNGTVPPEMVSTMKNGKFSVLRGSDTDFKNYPKGSILFAEYPALATKFDALINLMVTKPLFKQFFNKIHLNILNELYENLMNIYTNFNLQHVGIEETQGQQGNASLTFNIPLFLKNEKEYEANKKTLIINHFVNIIESQMNGKIKSIIPNIPHLFATSAGKTLIQNDYSIDLTQFIIKQIEPGMIKYKQLYLQGLATYLDFFQEFTSLLLQPHPEKPQHFTAFVHAAESVNKFIYGSNLPDIKGSESSQQVLQKMDPPLFTFNYDDIRALKLLPHLAKSLTTNSKSIEWPSHIVAAAEQGTSVSGHPIAYFKDNNENITNKANAERLYVVLQSGQNYFQEELLEQPDWLNNEDGIINILRGCFGDFSALIDLKIIDPCTETLIKNAISAKAGASSNDNDSLALICKTFLDDVAYLKAPHTITTEQPSSGQSSLIPPTSPSVIPQSSTDSLTPSISSLTPSDNNLIPQQDGLAPSGENLSPSDSDISSALNQ